MTNAPKLVVGQLRYFFGNVDKLEILTKHFCTLCVMWIMRDLGILYTDIGLVSVCTYAVYAFMQNAIAKNN